MKYDLIVKGDRKRYHCTLALQMKCISLARHGIPYIVMDMDGNQIGWL